ncbi:hypothetical protein R1flu_025222 [Riccia fluitans]|uniref:DUF2062 domain-containing protein n=1 Tax=Riccia fluitans TaxID=41844 RepID=A0ABD1XX46_9MARC
MPPAGRRAWGMRWIRQRITEPLVLVIRRGAEPEVVAFSGALGITLGIFPIYGVTALLCAFAIGLLGTRCNAPTMLLANLIATPVELSLVIPFLRLGEWVVGGKHLLLSKNALWEALTGKASLEVLLGLWHALVGWSVAAPVIVAGLYLSLLPLVKLSIRRSGSHLHPWRRHLVLQIQISGLLLPLQLKLHQLRPDEQEYCAFGFNLKSSDTS